MPANPDGARWARGITDEMVADAAGRRVVRRPTRLNAGETVHQPERSQRRT
ncbi:hypothetical protein OG426_52955 [Streptomyces canus]|uniref:hypothetical protein n=1 Tax=Streptomyces canus TaxID=58343 RepID=UPI002251346D|nr:hypothetical protein [Streptomyces canus]MCX4854022.1 hypothetical protein [Streptomyces canus]WSW40516.1 hypothetical protein OG426_52955 [Streptomyces canus]